MAGLRTYVQESLILSFPSISPSHHLSVVKNYEAKAQTVAIEINKHNYRCGGSTGLYQFPV